MPSRGIIMAIYDRGGGQFREGPTCRNSDSHVGAGGGRTLERGTLPGQAGTSTGPKFCQTPFKNNIYIYFLVQNLIYYSNYIFLKMNND